MIKLISHVHNVLYVNLRVALIGCLCATHVTLIESIYGMVTLLWLVLFCGGAVLPACSGKQFIVGLWMAGRNGILYYMIGHTLSSAAMGRIISFFCSSTHQLTHLFIQFQSSYYVLIYLSIILFTHQFSCLFTYLSPIYLSLE